MAGAGNADLRSSTLWVGKHVQGSVGVGFRVGCGGVMFGFVDGVRLFYVSVWLLSIPMIETLLE